MKYDVIIAGSGPAGISAALESARSGYKTALIERYGCVGGNLTMGYVGPLLGTVCKGTIAEEIEDAICPARGMVPDFEKAKIALTALLDEAGVDVYLQTMVTGAEKEGSILKKVHTDGKFGHMAITGYLATISKSPNPSIIWYRCVIIAARPWPTPNAIPRKSCTPLKSSSPVLRSRLPGWKRRCSMKSGRSSAARLQGSSPRPPPIKPWMPLCPWPMLQDRIIMYAPSSGRMASLISKKAVIPWWKLP